MFERKFQHLQPSQPSAPPPVAAESNDQFSEFGEPKLDPQQELKREQESEAKITFRLKSAAGAGLIMIIIYALIQLPTNVRRGGDDEPISMREMSEQEEFEALRLRHNTEAAKKQGFLQKIFCGSHQRSKFCHGEE